MKLYYYNARNFGDQLNPWLWPRLLNDAFDSDTSSLLVGIGTILTVDVPIDPYKLVFGSGAGYLAAPVIDDKWSIYCVRGPLTCQQLGIPSSLAITDGALLVRLLDWPDVALLERPAFIPHHVSATMWDWRTFCEKHGIRYIDPAGDVEQVIHEIRCSPVVYTEAMHGAILADAFRVPWVPLQIYPQVNEMKWRDWMSTIDLEYRPVRLRPLFSHAANRPFGRMSKMMGRRVAAATRPTLNRISSVLTHAEHIRTLRGAKPLLSNTHRQLALLKQLDESLSKLRSEVYAGVAAR